MVTDFAAAAIQHLIDLAQAPEDADRQSERDDGPQAWLPAAR
jgi:hypothetical protein